MDRRRSPGYVGIGREVAGTFAYQSGRVPEGKFLQFDPDTVIDNLNKTVRKLLTQSGERWSGSAAVNFGLSYSADASYATVVSNAAWSAADTIIALVWQLYGFEIELETIAQPLADHGYRIYFNVDGERFTAVGTPEARFGWDQQAAVGDLKNQYDKLAPMAKKARSDAARALDQRYGGKSSEYCRNIRRITVMTRHTRPTSTSPSTKRSRTTSTI